MASWGAQTEALEYTSSLSPCPLCHWTGIRGGFLGLHGLEAPWRHFLLEGCGKKRQDPGFHPGSPTGALRVFGQVASILGISFLICKMRGTGFNDAKVHPTLRVGFHGSDSGRVTQNAGGHSKRVDMGGCHIE